MSTKDFSSKQENLVAKFLGGKTVVASGSRPFHPGDVTYKDFLIECKTHESEDTDIVFYKSVWNKICEEAYSKFLKPLYVVDDGSQDILRTWCMFSTNHVHNYVENSYPYRFRKNIIFSQKELKLRYYQDLEYSYVDDPNCPVIYTVRNFSDSIIGICPLQHFKDIS